VVILANDVRYMLSPFRLSSVCMSSVPFVHPTHCLVPWPYVDIHGKFYGNRPRGTPPSGG